MTDKLSQFEELNKRAGAVSRYKYDMSYGFVTLPKKHNGGSAGIRVQQPIRNFIVPAEPEMKVKDQKKKRAFEVINHLWFLLGWRLRHQAKSMTSLFTLLTVLWPVIFY